MSFHAIVRVDGRAMTVALVRTFAAGETELDLRPIVFETVELAEAAARACVPNLEVPEASLVIGARRIKAPQKLPRVERTCPMCGEPPPGNCPRGCS